MTMITEDSVTLQLTDTDFYRIVANALSRDIIQASKYGYTVDLEVTGIEYDQYTGWSIDYELHAEEKVT